MDSCLFAWCGSLIITCQSTFCHVCLFLRIHSVWHDFFLQFVFLHILSKSLWSRLHVDFFHVHGVKSTFFQVVHFSRPDDIWSRESSQITLGRVTPTVPRLAKATAYYTFTPDYIGTGDSHVQSHISKAIGLLYLYLVGLMVILRVSYPRSGRVGLTRGYTRTRSLSVWLPLGY